MKKLTTLLLAAGLVVSSFAGAQAGELKPILQLAEEFTYGASDSAKSPENFNATTRIRFGFDYVASEDLSATILFQYRNGSWGHHDGDDFTSDFGLNSNGNKAGYGDHSRLRLAYIDWNIPSTDVKVRMGRHSVVAPSYAFGSAVLDGRGDGITIASAINDNINVGFSWFRIDSATNNDKWGELDGLEDDSDAVMLNAEFAYDGFKVAPWLMYAHQDANAQDYTIVSNNLPTAKDADAFVIGLSGELNMFDPFVVALDALYSTTNYHNVRGAEDSFDGFYVALKGSYKFTNGTASLGGWYATGDDNDAKNDNGFLVLDGGFSASTIMFDGNMVGVDGYTNKLGSDSPFGTWGLIAEYADFSFLENLSHTARILYIQGTSDNNNRARKIFGSNGYGMTEDDSVVEIDFDTTYQIYKNLSATLQLGYAIFDQSKIDNAAEQDDIFRSALTFVYKF